MAITGKNYHSHHRSSAKLLARGEAGPEADFNHSTPSLVVPHRMPRMSSLHVSQCTADRSANSSSPFHVAPPIVAERRRPAAVSFVVCGQATQVVPPAGGVSVRQGGPGDGQTGGHRPAGAQLQRRSAARVKTHSHPDILPPG